MFMIKPIQQTLVIVSLLLGGGTVAAAQMDPPGTGASVGNQPQAQAMSGQDRSLARDQVCTRCHDEYDGKVLTMYQTPHGVKADARTPSCQSCHGESIAHIKNPEGKSNRPEPDFVFSGKHKSPAKAQVGQCMQCHQSGLRMNWAGSQHQSHDVACSSCHKVHVARDAVVDKATQPPVCFTCHKTQRAQTLRISTHPLAAGTMGCTDCHNPHGSIGPHLLKKNSVTETCYTCHAEKRGPFLWEHPPVAEDCTNCHTPHGSNITPLLKARVPWLCQRCHASNFHPSTAYSGRGLPVEAGGVSPAQQMLLKSCLNCHSEVHGSNSPSGARKTR